MQCFGIPFIYYSFCSSDFKFIKFLKEKIVGFYNLIHNNLIGWKRRQSFVIEKNIAIGLF